MLTNLILPEDRHYENGTKFEPIGFYLDSLCNCTSWDLLLGYFSSAAINILSLGFASFIHNGGNVRLIINNVLSEKDRNIVKQGNENIYDYNAFDLKNIKALKNILSKYDNHFFECLAYLISQNRIQIRVIAPEEGKGISHYKSGVFYDSSDTILFHGSCNLTAYGLLENLEEIDIVTSWDDTLSQVKIGNYKKKYDNIFNKNDNRIKHLGIEDITIAIKDTFGNKDINELIIQEKELIELKSKTIENKPRIKKTLDKISKAIEIKANEPSFPNGGKPRDYQIEAYQNWLNNDYHGIFAMATGTGKTITALNCLLEEYKKHNYYRAVIIVPTISLVEQWQAECKKFNFRRTFLVNSKNKWSDDLSLIGTEYLLNDKISFIVIVTYAAFVKEKFQNTLKILPSGTLLIADEAHNIGATNVAKALPNIKITKRIGLSATPERQYDDVGNKSISSFFKDSSPYIYSYTMEEAIKNKILCKYKYFPHIVPLTKSEQEEYIAISIELMKFFNKNDESFFDNPFIQMKLLQRKRIIHKAANKLSVFKEILQNEFSLRNNLKYTLVYVPEGIQDNEDELAEEYNEDMEDEKNIDLYTRTVREIDNNILVAQFTSNTSNRISLIQQFAKGDMHVLTSMKCLDEGVDVPRAELAIFCASTGNPRQFIQRRGRILRIHKDKTHSVIHDLVVIPHIEETSETYELERSLLKRELNRVINFSSLSTNKMYTYKTLENVLKHYQLNLYD